MCGLPEARSVQAMCASTSGALQVDALSLSYRDHLAHDRREQLTRLEQGDSSPACVR
jgi:hypothetical protein